MRRKGRKVIKPAGSELMDYLNKGYAICNKCGAVMDRKEDPEGGCGIYACPSCGWEKEFFDERAGTCTNGLWPTVTIRQIMWALKMKPLQKQRWETVFDRRDI